MDQSFSIKNLNELLKDDRDKGGDLEERYIPAAFDIRVKLYKLNKLQSFSRYRLRIGKMTVAFYDTRRSRLATVIDKRKAQHAKLIDSELEKVSKNISGKGFRINVALLPATVSGKKVYGVGNSLDQILAVRFVQRALKVLYELRMPSRDILVSQIKSLALDGVPKYIIRSDVESFYESVRHKELLEGIHKSPELSVLIKRILTRLLKDYVAVSGGPNGLPRGIGVSAYLSEIYLSSIDAEIKRQDDLFYYARYVDDMVLMYAPQRKELVASYLPNLRKMLGDKGLAFNDKTKTIDLLGEQKGKFDYLGYTFDVSSSSPGVRLSQRKFDKYKSRIDKAFSDYSLKCGFIPKRAANELLLRCLFLTGNMRLFNRKSNAFIGVYFSNKYITETGQLSGLDHFYRNKITGVASPSLKRRLSKLSFEKGFKEKLFRNFDSNQLSELSRGWKHV
ncbi:antiviral reverse transcriptase Drt3a [Pseudomonas fragariae (ex Marin et al. 2024)]|uniref:antiviral reverse transcriptase Drt3a n=1 Tax=Pseudomonas TaxID=286 RepID=UPI001F110833|nr:antiviral reverse transcriptase Drt3a [Pseudomonas syringae]MCH5509127.1 RNA-directed DNA polymerase [Pseudomonas syringae pv. syringae]MCH5639168.1 RNA-directed DNA polymerase [Pseudomonas syringae pv. syringae]MCH7428357.1 RNA-directed DNA polymerase [Pseudomonas syringae pv. syringae]